MDERSSVGVERSDQEILTTSPHSNVSKSCHSLNSLNHPTPFISGGFPFAVSQGLNSRFCLAVRCSPWMLANLLWSRSTWKLSYISLSLHVFPLLLFLCSCFCHGNGGKEGIGFYHYRAEEWLLGIIKQHHWEDFGCMWKTSARYRSFFPAWFCISFSKNQ